MQISKSIITGILVGGSNATVGSSRNRVWNRAWDRLFMTCADHLTGHLARHYPNLNHADAEDVVCPALMKTYKSLKAKFDPERDKIESWIFTNLTRTAIDLLRKKGRYSRFEGMSLDAAVDGDEGLQLHEIIGAEASEFEAMQDGEVQSIRKAQVSDVFDALKALGKCSSEKIEIYQVLELGEKPAVVAERFGKTRSYVDSTKNEIKYRLTFINQRMSEGASLRDAVAESTAKPKNKS